MSRRYYLTAACSLLFFSALLPSNSARAFSLFEDSDGYRVGTLTDVARVRHPGTFDTIRSSEAALRLGNLGITAQPDEENGENLATPKNPWRFSLTKKQQDKLDQMSEQQVVVHYAHLTKTAQSPEF